jgi:hypothetical protein
MSYLRYVCLLGHSGSQHILCFCFAFVGVSCLIYVMRVCPPDIVFLVLFLFCFSSFCAPCVSSFYGLSIYLVGSVLLIFLVFLCCPIMYLYILSSVIWCPLRSPHKSHVHFVFTYSSFQERSCLINIICVCLRFVVSNTYCVVLFILIVIVLCAKCCQSLWIVYFSRRRFWDWPR